MDRIIEIKLFDRDYAFKADANASDVEKIVQYVVNEVEKAQGSAESPKKLDTVILAALNIANEFFQEKRGHSDTVRNIENRCKVLVDYIDKNL